MHPHVDQLVKQLQWYASVEGESLDAEYCETLNPVKILAKARRAGLQIEEAREGIAHLRDAKVGDSEDSDAPNLLTKCAFRLLTTSLWEAFNQEDSDSGDDPETTQDADRKGPIKKQPPAKRRKVNSAAAVGSGSQNPPDDDNVSQPAAAAAVGAPNQTPAKARSTRSSKSFKGKHILHVAEDAASPHAEDERAMEAERSKPTRTQTIPLPKAAGPSKSAIATSAKRKANSERKALAPFQKMPPYRTMMLSAVRDSPAGQGTDTACRVQLLADTLAGTSETAAAVKSPKKKRGRPKQEVDAEADAKAGPSKKARKGSLTATQVLQTTAGKAAAAAGADKKRAKKEAKEEAGTSAKKTKKSKGEEGKVKAEKAKGEKAKGEKAKGEKVKGKKSKAEKAREEEKAAAEKAAADKAAAEKAAQEAGEAEAAKAPRILEDSQLPDATAPPPAGEVIESRLPPEQLSLLLQVYSFLHETKELLAIKEVPSLSDLEASLFSPSLSPTAAPQAAPSEPSAAAEPSKSSAAPYVAAVVPLLQLVASDIYSVVKDRHIEKSGGARGAVAAQERDLLAGQPAVKAESWQHVCSGIFAGVALGQHLAQSDNPDHRCFKPSGCLGGLPGTLDPMLWVYFLNGTFSNAPSLRPEAAMLPECTPDADLTDSSEALLQWHSAQAVAQAEGMFEAFGASRPVPAGVGADSGAGSGSEEPTAAEFLDRVHAALPESMADTLCWPASRLAAAARAGRTRGLLGMFALANAEVYSSSTYIAPVTGASTRRGERAAKGEPPHLNRVKGDVVDLLGVVQAAEKRCTVQLEGEFAAEQTGVAAALATAYEKACKTTSAAAVAATQPGKGTKTPRGAAGKGACVRFQAVVQETEEELARSGETPQDTQAPGAQQDNLAGFERLACMLNGSSDQDMSSEDWLSILHALVLLASDTNGGRAALRSAHDMHEALRTERFNVKKRIGKTQKEITQSNKAAKAALKEAKDAAKEAEKQSKSGAVAAGAKADSAQKETIYTRSRGENPKDALDRDRARVAVLDKQLQDVQVKLSPHLGQDRQHNEFWCLEVSGPAPASKQLVVLCQEYSHQASQSSPGVAGCAPEGAQAAAATAPPLLFCEGASTAHSNVERGRWKLYRTAESLETLMEWLHSNGERERVLKARLQVVHAAMLARSAAQAPVSGATKRADSTAKRADSAAKRADSAPKPVDSAANTDAVGACANPSRLDRIEETERGGGDSLVPAAAAEENVENETPRVDADVENDAENVDGNANKEDTTMDAKVPAAVQPEPQPVTGCPEAAEVVCPGPPETTCPEIAANSSDAVPLAPPGSPQKLGEFLLSLEQSLESGPIGKKCFLPAWGDEKRGKWRGFVAAATGLPLPYDAVECEQVGKHPRSAMAAVILLEGMVRAPLLRTFWRMWSLPPPLPDAARTWAAVWHRAHALRRALRLDAKTSHLAAFTFDFTASRKRMSKEPENPPTAAAAVAAPAAGCPSGTASKQAVPEGETAHVGSDVAVHAQGSHAAQKNNATAVAAAAALTVMGASGSGAGPGEPVVPDGTVPVDVPDGAVAANAENREAAANHTQSPGGRSPGRKRSINDVAALLGGVGL